jgi:hypothetical protein
MSLQNTKKFISLQRGEIWNYCIAYSIDKYIKSRDPKTEHLVTPEGTLKCNEKEKRNSKT